MRPLILCSWTFSILLLLAGPAWTQPTWQWAGQWARQSGAGTEGSITFVEAVAADAAGNTVVMGGFTGSLTLGTTTHWDYTSSRRPLFGTLR